MSIERKQNKESYKRNRTNIFEIYGIDPKDKKYNCHHIVTKSDHKKGVINLPADINCQSNLYPISIRLHPILHQIIDAADRGGDIKPFLEKWKQVESELKSPIVQETSKIILVAEIEKPAEKVEQSIQRPLKLNPREENTAFSRRLSREDLNKLLSFTKQEFQQPTYSNV
jgi:hypothetical protein